MYKSAITLFHSVFPWEQMTLKLFLVALFTDVTVGRYSAGTENYVYLP